MSKSPEQVNTVASSHNGFAVNGDSSPAKGKEMEANDEARTPWNKNIKCFFVCYASLLFCVFSLSSFQEGAITTMEKQFGLSGQEMGLYLSANRMSSIPFVILLTYVCRKWSHPPLLGAGGLIYCLSSLLHVLPHLVYGTSLLYTGNTGGANTTDRAYCTPNTPPEECDDSLLPAGNKGPFVMLFIANILRGIGHSPLLTLGMSYLYINAENSRQAAIIVGRYIIAYDLNVYKNKFTI